MQTEPSAAGANDTPRRRSAGLFSAETMSVNGAFVRVERFLGLPEHIRQSIEQVLSECGLEPRELLSETGAIVVPRTLRRDHQIISMPALLGRAIGYVNPRVLSRQRKFSKLSLARRFPIELDFSAIRSQAAAFADQLEGNWPRLCAALLKYESFEVAQDETARTLDLLRSLHENAGFFRRRIGRLCTFLPKNQPLYALACFGIVPALMAEQVFVRPPGCMHSIFNSILDTVDLPDHFGNIEVSYVDRESFVESHNRTHLSRQARTHLPDTDAVIFTGSFRNSEKLRRRFPGGTLFVANGAGHNPIVVAEGANLEAALRSALRVQLYNSGQDCARPNTVLVHDAHLDGFLDGLRTEFRNVNVGPYEDHKNRVGPLCEKGALKRIHRLFYECSDCLDPATPGVIRHRDRIVEPTLIVRPLRCGGNFTEYFAPVCFVQGYRADDDLASYFEDPRYAPNAMYVTVFGHSRYVEGLPAAHAADAEALHDESTIIRDTDLHAPRIERGTQPYGGYGRGASSISIYGILTQKPTLPQRDIYQQLVLPAMLAEAETSRSQ